MIIDKVLEGLRIPRSLQVDPLDQVVEVLFRQQSLLVLDNLEHLLDDTPDRKSKVQNLKSEEGIRLVCTLLERVPILTCFATSRQRLNLEGERLFEAMPLPTPEGEATLESLAGNPSVQLFVDRAQAVKPDFQVTPINAPAVAELCQRLEGIPLALELAAARVQAFSPSQMSSRLEHRFDFLVSRRRDVPERHQTLQAAIEWSCRLLTPELQRFFKRLSVFRGGWDPEAAGAVCEEPSAWECLGTLAECSLVRAEETGQGMRYRMLESLREYGKEQLSPEELAALEKRHADYYTILAEEADPKLKGPEQLVWLKRLAAEIDNLRTALEWSQGETGNPGTGLRLAGSLGWFWVLRDYWEEGFRWLQGALAKTEGKERRAARAKALTGAGWLAVPLDQCEAARSLHAEALAISREIGDKKSIADALKGLGNVAWRYDFETASLVLEESLALYRELGETWGIASALNELGNVPFMQQEYVAARSLFGESLALFRETGDRWGMAWTLHALGTIALRQGDDRAAYPLLEESLARFREIENRAGMVSALGNMAQIACNKGNYGLARLMFEECLALWREVGRRENIWHMLIYIGNITYIQENYEEARLLYEKSLTILKDLGNKNNIPWCLELLSQVFRAQGEPERAARLFGAGCALREASQQTLSPEAWIELEYDKHLAALRETLGDAAFTAAWEAGRAMTWEEAVDYALEGSKV